MRNTLRKLAGAAGVAALALGPLATLTVTVSVLSVDAAQAKGNGGGNGNGGGGRGGGNRGAERGNPGGNGQGASNGNRGGNRAAGRPAVQDGAERGNRGANRAAPQARGNRGSGAASRSGGGQAARGNAPKGNAAVHAAKRAGFHPSELGNMNGAMNANINAVLAHIRNGNTNGPVGRLAGLAVADAGAAGARELLDSAATREQIALRDALAAAGYESLAEYEAAVAADPTLADPSIDAAVAGLGAGALAEALAAAGYADLAAYEAAIAGDPTLADPAVEAAIAGFGAVDEELLRRIAEAEDALAAVSAAEQALLDSWNKNGDADPTVLTEAEQQLLDALRARLAPHGEAIASAVGESEVADGGTASDIGSGDDGSATDPLFILQ